MIYVFSGWREWTDYKFIKKFLDDQMFGSDYDEIRVGDCPSGVDRMIQEELNLQSMPFTEYEADWDQLGKMAGPIRNNNMLIGTKNQNRLAELLVAFPQPSVGPYPHSGTWDCIGQAWRLGIDVLLPAYRRKEDHGNYQY